MRRIVIVGALVGVGLLIVRARHGPKLRERLMARCESMFKQMPDDFPPKRMMSGLEEIGVKTGRILELLEERNPTAGKLEPRDEALVTTALEPRERE